MIKISYIHFIVIYVNDERTKCNCLFVSCQLKSEKCTFLTVEIPILYKFKVTSTHNTQHALSLFETFNVIFQLFVCVF